MSDIAIRVENPCPECNRRMSKQYPSTPLRTGRIGGSQARYKTLRESLTEAAQAPFRRLSSVVRGQSSAVSNETIWALKDVSFEVKRGEVVGIPSTPLRAGIGRNGAGTLAPCIRGDCTPAVTHLPWRAVPGSAGEAALLKILSRITEPTESLADTCGGWVGSAGRFAGGTQSASA